MDIILKRVSFSNNGTFGVMIDADTQRCLFVTVERPWMNNEHKISCIRAREYTCKKIISPKHGECFQVMDDTRDMIEIHSANLSEQLEGCIALGLQFGSVNGTPAIVNSKIAVSMFMEMQKDINEFNLRIIEMR